MSVYAHARYVLVGVRRRVVEGSAQHPLAYGKVGQNVVGDVGRDLGHAPCVARGADATALA